MATEEETKSEAYGDTSYESDGDEWSESNETNWHETDDGRAKVRTTDGLKLISAYHFIWSLFLLLLMCGVSVPTIITGIVGVTDDPEVFVATAILGFVVFVFMLLSIISGFVGYGIWTQRQWARTAALALGILSLPTLIGTIGGALIIWYLLKDEVAQQFW